MTVKGGPIKGAAGGEPAVNLPWPVVSLVCALIGAHVARLASGGDAAALAFVSEHGRESLWPGLLSHMIVHANWLHLGMNVLFIVAFGAPVARWLGTNPRGAAAFFAFFIACGLVAALGFAGLARLAEGSAASWALVGASGAAAGLMAATARLVEGRGSLGPIGGRAVALWTLGWAIANVVLGLLPFSPGSEGLPVAWQAHIVGFVAGLPLASVAGRLAGVATAKRI